MIESHRSAVMFHGRIEMGAGGCRIGRRAIAFFMNMESVFARREVLNIGNYLNVVADFCERNRAGYFTAGLRRHRRRRFRDFLRPCETGEREKHGGEDNRFHPPNLGRSAGMKTLNRAGVARFPRMRRLAGRAKTASACDARSPTPNRLRRLRSLPYRPRLWPVSRRPGRK